jgi:hypothetical protein
MLVISKEEEEDGGGRYQQGLCKLGAAIDRFASIDRVLMIVRLVPSSSATSQLDLCGWTPHPVLPLDGPKKYAVHAQDNTYLAAHVYTKLRAWALTQYAAVLYLDLDTVVGQFSALFEVHLPEMRARGQTLGMGRNTHPDGIDYNSGVILLVPYLGLFAASVQSIDTVPHDTLDTADQALLNAVFAPRHQVYHLPFQFNAMVSEKAQHPAMWADASPSMSILHYTCKPWKPLNCWKDDILDLCLFWHVYTGE